MKIQCDVCEKAPATVICYADEAALCARCDVEFHAANKLVSKHQRLLLQWLFSKLPRCDICQEKAAFIFCMEDRALFCRDCDESIRVAGTLSGGHQRFLATGIRMAPASACKQDPLKGSTEPANHNSQLVPSAAHVAQNAPSPLVPPSRAVDEFFQLSDYELGEKEEPSVGFGELDWFDDMGDFQVQILNGAMAAAKVPELPVSQPDNATLYRASKPSSLQFKKPRIELFNDVDEFLIVPDLG